MEIKGELLQEVEAGLIGQQRWLMSLEQKRNSYPEAADTLDPLLAKLQNWTVFLTDLRDGLRLSVVAERT